MIFLLWAGTARAYTEPDSCLPVSISISSSQPSVAVGQEFDLTVALTNNSTEVLHAFNVTIGNLFFVDNPDNLVGISFMEHFHIIDSHHPAGRSNVETLTLSYEEPNIVVSTLVWNGYPQLSHEWIQPGQTITLRLRLRAVGKPGTINIPVQYTAVDKTPFKSSQSNTTQTTDCYDTDTLELTVTEGSLPGPLLVQKTLLANDLHECIRLGEEVIALWQVMNTTDENRYVRFRDVIPGYLNYLMNIPDFFQFGQIANTNGTTIYVDEVLSYSADGENGILTSEVILIPPHSTFYYTAYYDVSAYAMASSLASTVYVWETDNTGSPASQPGNAIAFTNTPIPVCEPILTKTAVGDYCDVADGATIIYQVDVDRIIWGGFYAYTIFDDLLPQGATYIPTASADYAGPIFENYSVSGRTLWSRLTDGNSVQIPPIFDGNNPLYVDTLSLRYNLSADDIAGSELVNTFAIRNGTVNKENAPIDAKRAEWGDSQREPRRAGDFLLPSKSGSAKLADGFEGPSVVDLYEDALEVATASHSLLGDCFVATYTIDGYKFNDLNANGVRDAGEPGLQSWMIIAQSSAGTFTAVTDADGYYHIEGLPAAAWQVRESYQLGWVQSAPGGEGFYNVQLGEQVQSARLDFGNWKPAIVSGIKYTDIDGSGRRNEGEPTVEGVHIELRDLSGKVVQHTQTDGDGIYTFEGIAPGHYAVRETSNINTLQSQPGPQEGGFYYIVAISGSTHPDKDFGNYVPVSINGTVSEVVGKVDDGSTEEHDPTVRDFRQLKVQLERMGPDGNITPAKVAYEPIVLSLDEEGFFEARMLRPGNWKVQVLLADYWSATSPNPVDVFIPSGGSATIDFTVFFDTYAAPELPLSSITGNVYRNTTTDHLYDKATDVMVAGQTVRLSGTSGRGAGVDRTTTTGNDGSYRFVELPAGEYVVSLAGVADTLRQGWPWVDGHRVILGQDEHLGASFGGHATSNPPLPIDADLPWIFSTMGAYANLSTRIDDNGDGKADRRNFFSGPAALARTSALGTWPLTVAHSALRMAGTDSLGRTIIANGMAGGSVATIRPGAGAPGSGALGMWTQSLDLVFVLEGSPWYGPTATNVPAIITNTNISHWLNLHKAAEFVAQAGNAPVIRDPFGRTMAYVLSTSYVFTPGLDFGLTPERFFPKGGSGTGSGSGGIGTNDSGDRADVPSEFALGASYPNPFNPSTVVPFELAAAGQVRLAVYDITGRQVAVLVNTSMPAGRHTIAWDASGLPSGVYVVQLRAGGKQFVSKATLLK
jgi:hypothetical protein